MQGITSSLILILLLFQVTRDVFEAANDHRLFVRACVSDMGSGNRDMWKHIGIFSTRLAIKNYIDYRTTSSLRGQTVFLSRSSSFIKEYS